MMYEAAYEREPHHARLRFVLIGGREMPVKRRQHKFRPTYPEPIEKLIAGDLIEFSEDNRAEMIRAHYFNDYELLDEARQRAGELLRKWRGPA